MPEWKEEIRERLATLNLEPTREAEIVEELTQHIEALSQALRADGETKDEASRAVFAEPSDKNWSLQAGACRISHRDGRRVRAHALACESTLRRCPG